MGDNPNRFGADPRNPPGEPLLTPSVIAGCLAHVPEDITVLAAVCRVSTERYCSRRRIRIATERAELVHEVTWKAIVFLTVHCETTPLVLGEAIERIANQCTQQEKRRASRERVQTEETWSLWEGQLERREGRLVKREEKRAKRDFPDVPAQLDALFSHLESQAAENVGWILDFWRVAIQLLREGHQHYGDLVAHQLCPTAPPSPPLPARSEQTRKRINTALGQAMRECCNRQVKAARDENERSFYLTIATLVRRSRARDPNRYLHIGAELNRFASLARKRKR